MNYKKEFEERSHNLYFDVFYGNRAHDNVRNNDFFYYYNPLYDTTENYQRLFRNSSDNSNNFITFKIDYENQIKHIGNLGTGINIRNNNQYRDEDHRIFNNELSIYELNKAISDNYDYYEGTYSAYLSLGNK